MIPAGRPVTLKLARPSKPFTGLKDKVYAVVCPTMRSAADGLDRSVKEFETVGVKAATEVVVPEEPDT